MRMNMATDDRMQSETASTTTSVGSVPRGRDRLVRIVVVGAVLTLFLLCATLVSLAQGPNAAASTAAEKAFNVILPVLAGWVGTVLAFYFSAASQEHTNAILDRAIRRVGGSSSAPGMRVSERMIPFQLIFGVR